MSCIQTIHYWTRPALSSRISSQKISLSVIYVAKILTPWRLLCTRFSGYISIACVRIDHRKLWQVDLAANSGLNTYNEYLHCQPGMQLDTSGGTSGSLVGKASGHSALEWNFLEFSIWKTKDLRSTFIPNQRDYSVMIILLTWYTYQLSYTPGTLPTLTAYKHFFAILQVSNQ